MDNIGGAEIVVLALAQELEADIYTTNYSLEKIQKMGFDTSKIKIYSIGKIPLNAPFRQQMALARFRHLNLKNKYDLYIIAGDWALSGAVNNKPNLWYVHSPIREIWDFYERIRNLLTAWYKRPIYDAWVKYNRYLNKKHIKHAQKIICNSKNTQKRLKKFLNRDSIVINPPIETKKFKNKKTQDYWLSVNRLFVHKRVDIQTKAFENLPNENLIIVGSYEKARYFTKHANYIKKTKPTNVKILSFVDQEELLELYSHCKGFITSAKDEDFGMTPIEAMACGKPVIAPNEGGYKESIINNKTGILINDITPDKLAKAIKKMSEELKIKPNKYKKACLKQAKKFSTENFIKKIKREIKK